MLSMPGNFVGFRLASSLKANEFYSERNNLDSLGGGSCTSLQLLVVIDDWTKAEWSAQCTRTS